MPSRRRRSKFESRRRGRGNARDSEAGRFSPTPIWACDIREFCKIDAEGEKLLEAAVSKLGFSARAYDHSFKVARTIADLADAADLAPSHLAEAIQYRAMDRYY